MEKMVVPYSILINIQKKITKIDTTKFFSSYLTVFYL